LPHPIDEISVSQVQTQMATEMDKFSVILNMKLTYPPFGSTRPGQASLPQPLQALTSPPPTPPNPS
jgi:hypothetical protein